MKKIYFVRHGESEGNVTKSHQSAKTPLSEIGQSQAKIVALRFTKIQASLIIASPYLRAQQTAQAIAEKNNLKIETSDLFREKSGPSELLGLSHKNLKSIETRKIIAKHLFDQNGNWQYSDEETAREFIDRVGKALDFLSQRPEENLIVVCHSLVLHMIFTKIFSPKSDLKELYTLHDNLRINNTSISVALYDELEQKWSIDCLNDYSHLG
jgi:broad specificity phosphatase PhoE